MHTAGKIFGKICLKYIKIRLNFLICFLSYYVVCAQKGDAGTRFFSEGEIQQKGEVQTFSYAGKLPPPVPSLSGKSWSPHKENPDEGGWSAYGNGKGESEYFLSKQRIYSM